MGISQIDPLNPLLLAEHLTIEILPLTDLIKDAPTAAYFLGIGNNYFSATTIFEGASRLIIHNDSHSKKRQNSNLAHELAHALLQHPPSPHLNDLGLRNVDKNLEDEANWLSGVLLVTENAALNIVRSGMDASTASDKYGVSVDMIKYRLNVTGAYKRV